ncbi:MAG: DUF5674 family protein [Patescibacteria group bacterium]
MKKEFPIEIISEKISPQKLRELADESYERLIKFVADIEREVIAAGGEMHADAEALLLADGSEQENLWGANFYLFEKDSQKRVEFISLINIRPREGNRKMEIESPEIREKVQILAEKFLFSPNESID